LQEFKEFKERSQELESRRTASSSFSRPISHIAYLEPTIFDSRERPMGLPTNLRCRRAFEDEDDDEYEDDYRLAVPTRLLTPGF
jgi:hypothetical protein